MKTSVNPSPSASSRSRSRICVRTETSRALTGSSAITSAGDGASARAIATRWRCPPENWWG